MNVNNDSYVEKEITSTYMYVYKLSFGKYNTVQAASLNVLELIDNTTCTPTPSQMYVIHER